MKTADKATLVQLRKQLRDVESAIAEKEPLLFRQWAYLREVIQIKEAEEAVPSTSLYQALTPAAAIRKCLQLRGTFMSKREIIDELERGGQIKDPVNGRGLINDSINYLLTKKKDPGLITKDGKPLSRGDSSMETLVGLPEFRTR